MKVSDLPEMVAAPLYQVKVGDIGGPFEIKDMGVVILKVDARDQASSESVYNENAIRMAMMSERFPDEQKKYMAKLRKDAYVEISDAYRPIVSPVLNAGDPPEKAEVKESKPDTPKTETNATKTKSETSKTKSNGTATKPDRK